MIARRYLISGVVQGVGYRYFTHNSALKLGVKGYVRNLYDGRVEVYAIAEEKVLTLFKENLKKGPTYSKVTDIDETDENIDSRYTSFIIEH